MASTTAGLADKAEDLDQSVFINSTLTVKEVNTSKQQCTVSGFVNALWKCQDLENEELRTDYYSRDHEGPTIKEGLAMVASKSDYACCIDRPYVQKEIRWARKYNKKIITVFEKEPDRPGYFDYGRAWEKYRGTEWEMLLQIDATPYMRDTFQAEAMMKALFAKTTQPTSSPMQEGRLGRTMTSPSTSNRELNVQHSSEVRNEPGHWQFFLSHHQAHGGDQAQTLQLRFKEHGYTTWYDNAMLDKSEPAMEEGVKNCDFFVLVLTGNDSGGLPRSASGKALQGYIHQSNGRSYVDGFKLSFDHGYSTPFNPNRMFDNSRTESSKIKRCDFYYYPKGHGNENQPYAGLVKMAVQFEATLSQRIDMASFPFDRQILQMAFFVRKGWMVHDIAPDWVDTGYNTDREIITSYLSQSVVHYMLAPPWVSTTATFPNAQKGSGYVVDIRIERLYKYELRKIVLPLFVIVLIATTSLGLEPESTNDRIIIPTIMVLAISGFLQVILETVPKQPTVTKLDQYILSCWFFILSVVVETLAVKVVLERARFLPPPLNISAVEEMGGEDEEAGVTMETQSYWRCDLEDPRMQCPKLGEIDRTASAYHVAELMDYFAIICVLLFW